jgi:hypothetical protein
LGNYPPDSRLSWQVALLPFIEQDETYALIDQEQSWDAPRNEMGVSRVVKIYLCPAGGTNPMPGQPAITHYVGMAGVGLNAAALPNESVRAGVFGYDRSVTIKDITDGAMNTMLAVESFVNNGGWAAGGPATVRGIDPGDQPYIGIDRPFGRLHVQRSWFGTMPTSANVGMVDGSVRHIHNTVSPQVFEALATFAGGEMITNDF